MSVLHRVEAREGFTSPDYLFWCPGCKFGHGVWVTHPNNRTQAMWSFNGNMEKPSFSPSILIQWGQNQVCHLFVTDGKLHYCGDSTHALAGQVVDMVDMDAIPVEPPENPHPKT